MCAICDIPSASIQHDPELNVHCCHRGQLCGYWQADYEHVAQHDRVRLHILNLWWCGAVQLLSDMRYWPVADSRPHGSHNFKRELVLGFWARYHYCGDRARKITKVVFELDTWGLERNPSLARYVGSKRSNKGNKIPWCIVTFAVSDLAPAPPLHEHLGAVCQTRPTPR